MGAPVENIDKVWSWEEIPLLAGNYPSGSPIRFFRCIGSTLFELKYVVLF
jgi:hypothetical protein